MVRCVFYISRKNMILLVFSLNYLCLIWSDLWDGLHLTSYFDFLTVNFRQLQLLLFPRHLYEVISLLISGINTFQSLSEPIHRIVCHFAKIDLFHLTELGLHASQIIFFKGFFFLVQGVLWLSLLGFPEHANAVGPR